METSHSETTTNTNKRSADSTQVNQSDGNDSNDSDDEEVLASLHRKTKKSLRGRASEFNSMNCPYLDTVDRSQLDFDFEKICSVSLSDVNVYACLVCGTYFQGRGPKSHAHTHSLETDHHIFINLQTLKVYCLPDNYEVIDSSLDDIKFVINPTFSKRQLPSLDSTAKLSLALDNSKYLSGVVGLNNIIANDYVNVVIQVLNRVKPFRDFFLTHPSSYNLSEQDNSNAASKLVASTSELFRKLWNAKNFKAHVSPHVLLQAISDASSKRFTLTQQCDPTDFLSWFLNTLHADLGGTKKHNSSVVYGTFQGFMRMHSRKVPPVAEDSAEKQGDLNQSVKKAKLDVSALDPEYQETVNNQPYLFLALDLPPAPLFKDELDRNFIPQVPLTTLLSKYDGRTEKEYKTARDLFIKKFHLTSLPPYLILVVKRFAKNNFFIEKNPTIVNFPLRNLDMREYVEDPSQVPSTVYDLVANIYHEGQPEAGKGTYRTHVLHKATSKWYEMQDLHVSEILPQLIVLSETYILIYERRDVSSMETK